MIILKPIREDQLSEPEQIDLITLVNGEHNVTIAFQLFQSYDGQAYLISESSTVTIEIGSNDRQPLSISGTINSSNHSIITATLTDVQIRKIRTGYVKIIMELPNGSKRIAYESNVIEKIG